MSKRYLRRYTFDLAHQGEIGVVDGMGCLGLLSLKASECCLAARGVAGYLQDLRSHACEAFRSHLADARGCACHQDHFAIHRCHAVT